MNETRPRMLLVLAAAVLVMGGCDDMMDVDRSPPVVLEELDVTPGLVWPNVSADLRNTSSKTIQAVSWWATFIDGHNRPAYGLLRDRVANFIWQSDTIAPNETVTGNWTVTWFDLAVRIDDSGVCEVTFTDGSKWEPDTFDPNC